MSAGSQKFIIGRITAFSLFSIWFGGSCTSSSNAPPAPIRSVAGAGSEENIPSNGSFPMPSKMTSVILKYTSSKSKSPKQGGLVTSTLQKKLAKNSARITSSPVRHTHEYTSIPKGSYSGSSNYTVQDGDTLFYISWITGHDLNDLARRNNISPPYSLEVGQILKVGGVVQGTSMQKNTRFITDVYKKNNIALSEKKIDRISTPKTSVIYSKSIAKKNLRKTCSSRNKKELDLPTIKVIPPLGSSTRKTSHDILPSSRNTSWLWPTEGKIIENFSSSEGGNRGIDIAGKEGQKIISSAAGRVVYAGNALRGYGNLIIIKHNDNYLSAYAHNDKILVQEQENVQAGKKIATMGKTGTNSARLHFEIRYKGESVNPLKYLPAR